VVSAIFLMAGETAVLLNGMGVASVLAHRVAAEANPRNFAGGRGFRTRGLQKLRSSKKYKATLKEGGREKRRTQKRCIRSKEGGKVTLWSFKTTLVSTAKRKSRKDGRSLGP